MPTISTELDKVEQKLNDPSNLIWTRAELLRWYLDGLTELCEQSAAVRRFWISDIPPRYSYSIIYEWEDRYTQQGVLWNFTAQAYDRQYRATYHWEVEWLEGLTPTDSKEAFTQQWERAYGGETYRHYRFALPRNHDQIKRVAYDDERLSATSIRELDSPGNAWMEEGGEIDFWLLGAGRSRSIELYELKTAYSQQYHQIDADVGAPRQISGDRTYTVEDSTPGEGYAFTSDGDVLSMKSIVVTGLGHRVTKETDSTTVYFVTQEWEKNQIEGETIGTGALLNTYGWEAAFDSNGTAYDFAVGTVRSIVSPDRQYLLDQYQLMAPYGVVREFKSSVQSALVEQVVTPAIDLLEADIPDFMPEQLQKYIRYYTLSRAFGRVGEGRNGALADHYNRRFVRGVRVFSKLQDVAHRAREWRRTQTVTRSRPPRVRLPAEFPRVRI